MKITISTDVAAPVTEVWSAWTSPKDIEAWNAASDDWHCPKAELELRPGGRFSYRMEARDGSMGFDFMGIFTRVVPNEVLAFSLGDDREVVVEFIANGESATVRETFEAESEHAAAQQRDGWQAILNNFARHVQSRSSQPSGQGIYQGIAAVRARCGVSSGNYTVCRTCGCLHESHRVVYRVGPGEIAILSVVIECARRYQTPLLSLDRGQCEVARGEGIEVVEVTT